MNELKTPNPKFERLCFANFIDPIYQDLSHLLTEVTNLSIQGTPGKIPRYFTKKAISELSLISYGEATDAPLVIQFAPNPSMTNVETPECYEITYAKGTKMWILKTETDDLIVLKSIIIPPTYKDRYGDEQGCKTVGIGEIAVPKSMLQGAEDGNNRTKHYLPYCAKTQGYSLDLTRHYSRHSLLHPYGRLINGNIMPLYIKLDNTKEEYDKLMEGVNRNGMELSSGDTPLFFDLDVDRLIQEYGTLSLPTGGDLILYRDAAVVISYDDKGNFSKMEDVITRPPSMGGIPDMPYNTITEPYNYFYRLDDYYKTVGSMGIKEGNSTSLRKIIYHPGMTNYVYRNTYNSKYQDTVPKTYYGLVERISFLMSTTNTSVRSKFLGFNKTKTDGAFNYFGLKIPVAVANPRIVLNGFCIVK